MKESKQNFVEFLKTPLGTIIIFIVLLGLKKRAVSVTIEPTTADKNEV
jgi:hypothetical protein